MSGFDLNAFLPYQLAVAASRVSRAFAEVYQDRFGLSVAEWRVLAHLSQESAVSVRDIGERTDMDKPKVSRAVARLEAAGYLEKRPSTADRRLLDLALSDRGRALIEEIVPHARAFEQGLERELGEEAEIFRETLTALVANRTMPLRKG